MRRRVYVGFLVALSILAAGPAHAESGKSACVVRFTNRTGDAELDWVGYFIADSMEKNLKILPKLDVVLQLNPQEASSAQNESEYLCSVAKGAGAWMAIGGDYRKDGDQFAVTVSCLEADSGKEIGGASFTAGLTDMFARLDDLSISLAGAAGLSYTEAQNKKLHLVPTSSAEALETYGKALMEQPASEEYSKLLLQALSMDHSYTDALSALGIYYYQTQNLAKAQEVFDRLARMQPDYPNAFYNLGLVLNSRMHYSRSIEMYKLAVEQEPEDADIWNNLGVVYYQMGMYSDAEDAFSKAAKMDAGQEQAQSNLDMLRQKMKSGLVEHPAGNVMRLKEYIETGAALYASGDYSKAMEYFQKALDIQPDDFKANNNIALTYMKMGNLKKAKEHFQHALKTDPTAIDVKENLAYLETISPKDAAQTAADEEAPAAEENLPALRAAGKVYLSREAYAQAEDAFDQVLKQAPDDIESLHGLGLVYLAEGDFEKARNQFDKVLSLDPENEEAKKRLNDINFILASEKSQSSFPLSISPEAMARAHFVRANELYQSGDYEGAVGEYLRALDLEPANAEILNNLGTAYFAAGKTGQAKAVFEKANKLDANNETILRNLESAKLVESAHQKQKVELQQIKQSLDKPESQPSEPVPQPESDKESKFISDTDRKPVEVEEQKRASSTVVLNPRNLKSTKEVADDSPQKRNTIDPKYSSQVHFNMGVFKESEGDLEGALVQYREAVRLEPNNAVAQYNLGNIYFRLGAFESAIECYLAALKADARFSKGYNNIGVAYYKLGRIEEAKQAWERALQVDPEMQSARENLIKYGGGI